MLKCNVCGYGLEHIDVLYHHASGEPFWRNEPIVEGETLHYVCISGFWVGSGICRSVNPKSIDKQREALRCPHCHIYPFRDDIRIEELPSGIETTSAWAVLLQRGW